MEVNYEPGRVYVVKVNSFSICNSQLSNFLLDSRYIYGHITYNSRFTFGSETDICGTMLRAIEEVHNAIITCPEQHRTGKHPIRGKRIFVK